MPQLRTHEPDPITCAYCNAYAVGPCARCKAMICGDCCEIISGAVSKAAVCKKCVQKNAGDLTHRAWWWTLRLPAGFVLGIALLGLLLRSCS